MALTETRPETDASPVPAAAQSTTLDGLIGSADHKTVGRMWIGAGLVFLIAGLVVSVIAALEASDLGGFAIVDDADQFTQIWSLGRELLLFGAIVPILVGLGTYLVPLQIGAPAIAFARGAAGAFWTWLIATGLLVVAIVLNGGPGGGRVDFIVLWAVASAVMLAALAWAMVTLATTILGARTGGMTLERAPQTTWSFLVFSLVGLLSLPILIAELVLVYVRVRHGFVPIGTRQSLTGVMDSPNLVPALYWLAVPVLGMAVDIIGVHTGRAMRSHKAIMTAIGALGILSYSADFFSFASVRPLQMDHALLVISIAAAALPTLAVLGLAGDSIRNGAPRMGASLIGALVAGLLFLLATVVSLLGLIEPVALFIENDTSASIALDRLLILNGTTFHDGVRGLIIGATIVLFIAAFTHWSTKIWGRQMKEPLSLLAVLLAAVGAIVWALGAVLAGVDDQPAYPTSTLGGGENVEFFNLIAMIGIAVLTVGVVIAALNVAQAALGRGPTTADPWTGSTLEWATSSPPAFGNFDNAPLVRSATPLAGGLEAVDESKDVVDHASTAAGKEDES